MRKCCRCKEFKNEKEFCKNKKVKDGLNLQCRTCSSIVSKLYKQKNKNKIKEYGKKYRDIHKKERMEYNKIYDPIYREIIKHTPKYRYRIYKRESKKRNLEYNLTLEQFSLFFDQPCFYCGETDNKKLGIDRVDNNIGYNVENCVTCCQICNFTKHNLNYEKWINYIKQLVNFKINNIITTTNRYRKFPLSVVSQYNNYRYKANKRGSYRETKRKRSPRGIPTS